MLAVDISKLSVAQRLQIMEDLWDSLRTEQEINPPNWHQEALIARKKTFKMEQQHSLLLKNLKQKN